MRRLLTTAVALACAAGLAACSGGTPPSSSATTPSTTTTTAATVEPVQDVVVGGHHFQARCAGAGPAVMLVSGYGGTMDEAWGDLQARLGATARTCAYDRLGIGLSDPPPATQTFEDMARDLDGVITALHLQRPLVVVGHSLGGPVTVTWATHHAADLKTAVLLDPSPPGFQAAFDRLLPPPDPGDLELSSLLNDLADFDDPHKNVESLDPRAWTAYASTAAIDAPARILVRGKVEPYPASVDSAAIEAAWLAGQRRLAATFAKGELVTADRSGHFVAFDRPDLVLSAVRDALAS